MRPDIDSRSFSSDSSWGSRRPRGWGGFWLGVARALPPSWPWGRFALFARRIARWRMEGPVDVRAWGFKLRLMPSGSVSEGRLLFLPRAWDRVEREVLAKRLGPGAVFVDVGANAGGYAFWAASLGGKTGRVIAFEPDPVLARRLRWNVAANEAGDRLSVVEAAVSATPGRGTLVPGVGNSGENRLAGRRSAPEGLTVRVVTLADAVQAAGLERIDCLKVDVEGREADVLKPFLAVAPQRLWPRTLVVELGGAPPPGAGAGKRREPDVGPDLEHWIVARGYRLVLRTKLNGVFRLDRPAPDGRDGLGTGRPSQPLFRADRLR